MNLIKNKYESLSIITKSTIWFTISSFCNTAISVLTTPIVARMLTTSDYGLISVYHTWESLFTVIFTFNLFYGIQEVYIAKYKEDQDQVTNSLMFLCLSITCFFGFCYFIFFNRIHYFVQLSSDLIILMFFDILANSIMQFWFTQKRFNYAYKAFSIITITKVILRGFLGIIFIHLFDNKVFGRLFGLALPNFIYVLPIFVSIVKKIDIKRIFQYWSKAIRFNIVLIPHYLSGVLLTASDRIMISNYVGNDKAGIYSMMYSCGSLVGLFYGAANSALSPYILKSIKCKDYKNLNDKIIKAIIITVYISLGVILVAPELVKLYAPKEYYEGIILVPILILGLYFNFFYLIFSNFAFFYEKKYLITISTLISAFINIVLNIIFIPRYGYYTAAFTTVIGYVFLAIFNYFVMRIIEKERIFNIKKIVTIMLAFISSVFIIILLYNKVFIRYIMLLCLILIFYVQLKNRKEK